MTGVHGDEGLLGYEIPEWLSVQRDKRRLYGLDLYFREAWEELDASTDALRELVETHAVVVCKPDAVAGRRLHAGLDWFARQGFDVVGAEICRVTRHATRALWQFQWNIATRERMELTELLMAQSRSLFLMVRLPPDGVPATVRMAALKGPVSGVRLPHHLRHAMGAVNSVINSVHSTDEPADVVRELAVFLDAEQRGRVIEGMLGGGGRDVGALVAELYAETAEESAFGFEARVAALADGPLARRVAEVRAGSRDWRGLVAAASASSVAWSDWDTIAIGTELMTAHEPGLARVLPGVSPEEWTRRRMAAATG